MRALSMYFCQKPTPISPHSPSGWSLSKRISVEKRGVKRIFKYIIWSGLKHTQTHTHAKMLCPRTISVDETAEQRRGNNYKETDAADTLVRCECGVRWLNLTISETNKKLRACEPYKLDED